MARCETVPSSLARTSRSANGARSTGIAVLCSCVLLLFPVTRTNAAGHHAASSHAAVGTGHFAGFSSPPQTAHARAQTTHARAQTAHARGNWGRTVRASAGAKPLLHHKGTRKQQFVTRAQRRGHSAPVAPASGRTDPHLSSLTHRIQRMTPGQG